MKTVPETNEIYIGFWSGVSLAIGMVVGTLHPQCTMGNSEMYIFGACDDLYYGADVILAFCTSFQSLKFGSIVIFNSYINTLLNL